jgi:hypothetical protein
MIETGRAIRYLREGYSCSKQVLMVCAGKNGQAAGTKAAF